MEVVVALVAEVSVRSHSGISVGSSCGGMCAVPLSN